MKRFAPFHDRYPRELVALIESKKWSAFTAIQEEAIKALPIDPKIALPDAILEAETSSGKTEAVFLPLLARAHAERHVQRNGFSILYISPLRALINDQEDRIGGMAHAAGFAVHPWHSDVEAKKKDKARRDRTGILLTTPESLEAFFARTGHEGSEIDSVARVSAIVIDELHAFFDTARGRHLQSLLHRLDLRANTKIPRLGLSATLSGIDDSAREVLRPKSNRRAVFLRAAGKNARKVTIGIKVFVAGDKSDGNGEEAAGASSGHLNDQFAKQLLMDFKKDARGLVFCNSRAGVETLQERAKTTTIPIVFLVAEDPVKLGLVASLARPGGNLTGINFFNLELATKQLELLRALVPAATRVAVLVNPAYATNTETTSKHVGAAGRAMGLQIQIFNASTSREIDAAFATLVRERSDALFVGGDPFFNSRRLQLSLLAMLHKVPATYSGREYAEAGGLMTYGSDITDAYRQMGVYSGRILKGARPADLPVVQASKFELVINAQSARLLGLTVPPTLLATADEVIE